MTAGNLFCGFLAIIQIFQAISIPDAQAGDALVDQRAHIFKALGLILLACVFDLLDGRVARLGGQESEFGREFDSIADIVSFGMAPALLVYNLVLHHGWIQAEGIGWIIAFIYLLCGAMRLARFNVISSSSDKDGSNFRGFPIPAAAGVISSLTLLMLFLEGRESPAIGPWKYVLPPLMLLLSFMMFSNIPYPSFKNIDWRTRTSPPYVLAAMILLISTVIFYQVMPAVLFLSYFAYGIVRWIYPKRPKGGDDGKSGESREEDLLEAVSRESRPPGAGSNN